MMQLLHCTNTLLISSLNKAGHSSHLLDVGLPSFTLLSFNHQLLEVLMPTERARKLMWLPQITVTGRGE